MSIIICFTFLTYSNRQNNINSFIENSEDCVVLLKNFDEKEEEPLKNKLKKLTFQDVRIEQKNGVTYVKIKCPPDRVGFFYKWILENNKEKNE